jgi:arylsulfatase A-like enzyme
MYKFCFFFLILIFGNCTTTHSAAESQKPKPNIIFIMSDDHAYGAVGAYGKRLAAVNPTPVLDELAKGGMLFNSVFCTNSICTPSRANIITGQYSQTNEVLDLDGSLGKERQYLPQELKKLGYQTAIIGKWHLKQAPESFDYFNVLPLQGKYFDPILYTREPGDTTYTIYFHEGIRREVNVTQYNGHSSDVITDLTIDWLENKRNKEKPFFLMHHFKAPHDDFEYAPRYEDYLTNTNIPEPENLYSEPNFGSDAIKGAHDSLIHEIGTSVSDRHNVRNYTSQYNITTKPRDKATSEAYQKYVKRYLRCVKGVDDNLKRLFDHLKSEGLWENTIIVYTADQGMMLGEHDFIDKRWMYDESMRMPFIMSYPNVIKAGSTSDLLINNTDFAPTLIEMAGGSVPDYMQGMSFAKTIKGEKQVNWRKGTYYRYWMHLVHHDVPAHLGIRTDNHKLIYYYADHYNPAKNGTPSMTWKPESQKIRPTPVAWEFYDLSKDPTESNNLYDDPAYQNVIDDLKLELKELRTQLNETDENYPHLTRRIEEYWNSKK